MGYLYAAIIIVHYRTITYIFVFTLLRYLLIYQIFTHLTCLFPIMCVRFYLAQIMITIPQQCVSQYHHLWYAYISAVCLSSLFHPSTPSTLGQLFFVLLCTAEPNWLPVLFFYFYAVTPSFLCMEMWILDIPLFCWVNSSSLVYVNTIQIVKRNHLHENLRFISPRYPLVLSVIEGLHL